jgi:hypothetical protein
MQYIFWLNDMHINEPVGWADFELSMKRDDKTHGIQFEASTGPLRFYGAAAQYLIDQKEAYGIKANVVFTAQEFCDDPYTPFEEITGRLNFGQYKSTCGTQCIVSIPMEEDGCKVVFKNRYDHKVDLDLFTANDGMTSLAPYVALGITLDMPAKALQAAVDGSVSADDAVVEFTEAMIGSGQLALRPNYSIERYNNIQTGQLIAVSNWDSSESPDFPMTPQLLFEDIIDCFDGNFLYSSRLRGDLAINYVGENEFTNIVQVTHRIVKWDAVGDLFTDGEILQSAILFNTSIPGQSLPFNLAFDNELSGTTTIEEGVGVYAYLFIQTFSSSVDQIAVQAIFHTDTAFAVTAVRTCPTTTAQVYVVHETLSRVAESITNNCIRVKSNYYGRTDSQPFAFEQDGCGSLRMLTSGLKIRNAPDGKFFASMKELVDGLSAIDNIGFDIIDDPDIPGKYIMRPEDVSFFYQDEEIFIIDHIPQASDEMQEQMHYSKVNVGYKKWEVEGVNGLDEFNSTREYRTTLDTVATTLDITSNLVAGSYPYEITRQQNFADSGAADTKFDNDIFILTLLRNAYDFVVEQGNTTDPSGFFDPATIINAKLSPVRNLMRWFKTIAAGYVSLADSDSKLMFNAGTGNFTARMEVAEGAYDGQCKIENAPITENQQVFSTHFARAEDYTPLWKNEIEAFDYPLRVSEYKSITALPYGYISYRCGSSGEFKKGFIKEIKFKPARGMANFSLLKKWT